MRIRSALRDPDASTTDIARIVGSEPVLSAQVLRVCNCAAFTNQGKPVSDLRSAITRLGFSTVRNIAISVGMQQLKSNAPGKVPAVIEGLWKRSIRMAALSYVLAKRLTHLNQDTAMLAGLLHDIGKFYILNRARSFETLFADEKALWEIVDHWQMDIGEAILVTWEIPDEICLAVRDQRNPNRAHAGPPDLTDVIVAADFLDGHASSAKNEASETWTPPASLVRLKLDSNKIKSLMEETKEELALILQALN